MNPRIPVIGVVGAFAVVILIIAYSGTSVIDDTSGEARLGSSSGTVIEPLVIDLDEIIIKDVDERTAYVEIAFKVTNPNYKSVILEMIRYNVYEDGMKIGTKSIGDRAAPGGLVSASNYFTILSDRPSIIKDDFTIKNDGNIPELWNCLLYTSPSPRDRTRSRMPSSA